MFLLWWSGEQGRRAAEAMVPLAVAEKANERSAKLESRIEELEREIERLKDQHDTQTRIDARQDREIGGHKHE